MQLEVTRAFMAEGDLVGLDRLLARPAWQADAACLEHDPAWWFGSQASTSSTLAQARAVCSSCLVADDCRQFALADPDLLGVWAGLTDSERRALRENPGSQSSPMETRVSITPADDGGPPHGTLRRYKWRTRPCRCESCRAAMAVYNAEYRRRRSAAA